MSPLSDLGCSPIATERFKRGISGWPSCENSGKSSGIGSPMRNVQSSSKAQRLISYGQETRQEVEEIVGMAIVMEEKSGKENQMKVVIPTGYDLSDCLNVSAKQASAEPKIIRNFPSEVSCKHSWLLGFK